jgi:hypothetical protein
MVRAKNIDGGPGRLRKSRPFKCLSCPTELRRSIEFQGLF